MPDPYTQAFLTQAARGLQAPLWIGLASEEVGSRSGFCLPYHHPTFCLDFLSSLYLKNPFPFFSLMAT